VPAADAALAVAYSPAASNHIFCLTRFLLENHRKKNTN